MARKTRTKQRDGLRNAADAQGLAGRLEQFERGELAGEHLGAEERRALLLLGSAGRTQTELASLLGVSRACIQKDLKAIRHQVAKSLDLDTLVGGLVISAETLSARAAEANDPGTAWRITKELVEILMELGVVSSGSQANRTALFADLARGYERARELLTRGLDPRLTSGPVSFSRVGSTRGSRVWSWRPKRESEAPQADLCPASRDGAGEEDHR